MLYDQIKNDLKQAMRDKNELKLSVLRMLTTSIRNKEISERKGGEAELSDDQVLAVINSELKKRKDSIESYAEAGRNDLAEAEKKEAEVLETYLPAQMSDEDLEVEVRKVIDSLDDTIKGNFGLVMKEVMASVKGKADGSRVSGAVKAYVTCNT